MNIIEAIDDPNLFAKWYEQGEWAQWRVFLKAMFAIPPSDDVLKPIKVRSASGVWSLTEPMTELEVYRRFTGRSEWPVEPFTEVWMPIGRRGGKSLNLAVVGVFLAAFREYKQYLQPGERATIALLAADRAQSRIILRYVKALLNDIPMLKSMVDRETANIIDLSNQSTIEVTTASSRTSRGYTFAAVLCDEIAFWAVDESSNDPDSAILNAMEPGMATIPGSMLLCASSPYARKGELWRAYDNHYGKDTDVLVWNAPTWVMNPTVSKGFIDRKYKKDMASARAEFGAEFRTDVEAFVSMEVLRQSTDRGVFERANEGHEYVAFVDPSGGSSDSFTMAIGHTAGDEHTTCVVDCIREVRPPFSPENVVLQFSDTLRDYGVRTVSGDRYAGEWPREQFRKQGIVYDLASLDRTGLYLTTLPALNSGRVRLLDSEKLRNQFLGLERRQTRSGKEVIDHPRGMHDDVANAVAGLIAALLEPERETPVSVFSRWR